MVDKGRISAYQMSAIMYPTILSTAILIAPSITSKYAERDMWLSPIWASFMGFLLVYITHRLHKLHPNQTLIKASELILGRTLGKVFGFLFFFMYLHDTGFVVREYGEFIAENFLERTPIVITMGCIVIVSAFAVRGGVEVVARCAQLFLPLFVLFLFLIICLLLPDYEPKHLLPAFENGVQQSLRGSLPLQPWFDDVILMSFLLPCLANPEKAGKWGILSVCAITGTMVLTNIAVYLVFGEVTARLTFPFIVAARYISLTDVLQHLEALLMALWLMGIFIKLCMYYYAIVVTGAELLTLSDYRLIVFPIGLLLVLLGVWSTPNLQVMTRFFETTGYFYFMAYKMAIPLLLILVAHVRSRFGAGYGIKQGG